MVERLPFAATDPEARELSALRRRLASRPDDAELAHRLGRRYFRLADAEGDPRYIGYAEAILTPWAGRDDAPGELRVLRGMLHQWRHEFDPALRHFDAVLARDPGNEDALGWRAAVRTVLADYPGARNDCTALQATAGELLGASCAAYVDGLSGRAAAAEQALERLIGAHPDATPGQQAWILVRLADLADRRGDPALAARRYEAILALGVRSQFVLANYADHLLDAGRPEKVVELVGDAVRSDVLLLRLVLAERALAAPAFAQHAQALRQRFAAAALRGDTLHQQEASRFARVVDGDANRALGLAQANWAVQREPYDARILLEAARDAGRPEAAAPVLAWLDRSGHEDVRLRALARTLRAPPR